MVDPLECLEPLVRKVSVKEILDERNVKKKGKENAKKIKKEFVIPPGLPDGK